MSGAKRETRAAAAGSDRRGTDRRHTDHPFDGTDQRVGDRRTGTDRRTQPRPAST
jgi:hypothetical protein